MTAIVAMLAWLIGRSIARPLTDMSRLMDRLATGDLDVVVSGADRGDEVGVLARAVGCVQTECARR